MAAALPDYHASGKFVPDGQHSVEHHLCFQLLPNHLDDHQGDPANHTDTLVTYLYKLAFYNGKQGQAAAVSVIGFMILLLCSSVYMVYTLKKGDE